MLYILQTALELGLLYAPVALALFLSYRILDIADLTTDGAFTLGAAVSVTVCIAGHPVLAVPAAMAAGAAAGFVTAFLQTKMGVPSILAGIITNTGLYTINLMAMGWTSTASLLRQDTIFRMFQATGIGGAWSEILLGGALLVYDYDRFPPEKVLETLQETKVTGMMAQPTVYRMLTKVGMDKYDLSSITNYAVGGEKLLPDLAKVVQEQTGQPLYEGYARDFGSRRNAMLRMKELWSYLIHLFRDPESYAKKLRKAADPAEFEALTAGMFRELELLPGLEPGFLF